MSIKESTANQLASGVEKGSTENKHAFYAMLSNEIRRNQTLEAASDGFRQAADEFTRAFAEWGRESQGRHTGRHRRRAEGARIQRD